jgi:FKBP-type peptidyl-prolyl cis-trans isomerase
MLLLMSCILMTGALHAQSTTDEPPIQAQDQAPDPAPDLPWVELEPGLSIQVIKQGSGDRQVVSDDIVVIAYNAKVKGSEEYFAATKPNKGFRFQIDKSNVLMGIKKGVIGMRVGEQRKLMFEPKFGFGNKPATGVPVGSIIVVNVIMDRIQTPVRWEILSEGTGEKSAKNGDVLKVQYIGKLQDGTVFDTNESVTSPFSFAVGSKNVIKGMTIGSQGMKLGEKRRVVIPSEFGYGDKPRPKIPASSTLTFDLTCMAIEEGVVFKTIKPSKGIKIKDGEKGEFALRIEAITGKVYFDTQFNKPLKLPIDESLDPMGLYFIAHDMRVGEIRQGTIKPELGFAPGKVGAGRPLNVTMDLIRIVPKDEIETDEE